MRRLAALLCGALLLCALAYAGEQTLGDAHFPGDGTIVWSRQVEASTAGSGAPNILTAAESQKALDNTGTSAQNFHTLPTAAAGLVHTFTSVDSDGISVTAAAGDVIDFSPGGVTSATAGAIACTQSGTSVTLMAKDATTWLTVASTQPSLWTVDGTSTGLQSCAEFHWTSESVTTLSAATPAKAAGTTSADTLLGFSSPTSNQLQYDGIKSRSFLVSCSISTLKSGGGSTVGQVSIAVDGTADANHFSQRTLANANDIGNQHVISIVTMEEGQQMEIYLETDTGDDLTVKNGSTVTILSVD